MEWGWRGGNISHPSVDQLCLFTLVVITFCLAFHLASRNIPVTISTRRCVKVDSGRLTGMEKGEEEEEGQKKRKIPALG